MSSNLYGKVQEHEKLIVEFFHKSIKCIFVNQVEWLRLKQKLLSIKDDLLKSLHLYTYVTNSIKEYIDSISPHIHDLRSYHSYYTLFSRGINIIHQITKDIDHDINDKYKSTCFAMIKAKICDPNEKNVYGIYGYLKYYWKEKIFNNLNEKLNDESLYMINQERNGDTIDAYLIKAYTDSLYQLSMDGADSYILGIKCNDNLYQIFHQSVIENMQIFYRTETINFLENNSVVDYIKKADERLRDEQKRIDTYLSKSKVDMLKIVKDTLVMEHITLFQNEFISSLDNYLSNNDKTIGSLYNLLSLITSEPNGSTNIRYDALEQIYPIYQKHFLNYGLSKIESETKEILDSDNRKLKDPFHFINIVHELYNKFQILTNVHFQKHFKIVQIFTETFTSIMNQNSISNTNKSAGTSRIAELIAIAFNEILKKGSRLDENDIKKLLDKCIILIRYIYDKDRFIKFYIEHFGDRLVSGTSRSIEDENMVVGILQTEFSLFASEVMKTKIMLQDMDHSQAMISNYQNVYPDCSKLSIKILNFAVWSNRYSDDFEKQKLPAVLSTLRDTFIDFYKMQYSDKKLLWCYNSSKGIIQMKTNKIYLIECSHVQMCTMLLFNEKDKITFSQICDLLGLPKYLLINVMKMFIKEKIMISNPSLIENRMVVDPSDHTLFAINPKFSSDKVKMSIIIKTRDNEKTKKVEQSITFDRKAIIQATIVRIMKSKKTLSHNVLVTECISHVNEKGLFKPQVADVKAIILGLIDQDYIERDENNSSVYKYVA